MTPSLFPPLPRLAAAAGLTLSLAFATSACGIEAERKLMEAKAAEAEAKAEAASLRADKARLEAENKELTAKLEKVLSDLADAKDELTRAQLQKQLDDAKRGTRK